MGKTMKFQMDKFLNSVSQPKERLDIVMVDVYKIRPNPDNFYHVADDEVKALAAAIELQGGVKQPLELKPAGDDSDEYILIAGERRSRAVKMLLEEKVEGITNLVPATIKKYDDHQLEMLDLILSNRTQRTRTSEEILQEVKHLEDHARKIYEETKKKGEFKGRFRKFFAEEILGISDSKLQRVLSAEKLDKNIKEKVSEGQISETASTFIAGFNPEIQREIVKKAEAKGGDVTEKTIKESIDRLKREGKIKSSKKKEKSSPKQNEKGDRKRHEGEIIDEVNMSDIDKKLEAIDYIKNIINDSIETVEKFLQDIEADGVTTGNVKKDVIVDINKKKIIYLQEILSYLDKVEAEI